MAGELTGLSFGNADRCDGPPSDDAPRRSPARIEAASTLRPASELAAGEMPAEVAAIVARGEAAWRPFIGAYSGFILSCIRRLSGDHDERMDIYLHVCARLYSQDCRRVKQFRGSGDNGACKFTTWLAAVVFNLGREWIRSKRGRRRLYRKIRELPELDRIIFRYRFWEGFDMVQIARFLQVNHRVVVSEEDVASSVGRMLSLLGCDQLWRLVSKSAGYARQVPLEEQPLAGMPGDRAAERRRSLGPAADLMSGLAVAVLREVVGALPDAERRALTLKYGHGMNAKEIAAVLEIVNYKRVYELQAKAIVHIRKVLVERGVSLSDFGTRPGTLELLK